MTPRITPAERSRRVSARVSIPAIADDAVTPPGSREADPLARQLLATSDSLRMTKPATCGARDSTSSDGHAVVADFGAGHRDNLPGVGRVREDLLVPRQPGVEHDFAGRGPFRADGRALEPGAIFQSENRLHRVLSLSSDAVIRRLSPAATVSFCDQTL